MCFFRQTAHAAGGSDVSVSLPADKNDRSNFAERSTAQDCISSEKVSFGNVGCFFFFKI